MYDSTGLTSTIKVDKAKFDHLILKPVGDEKLEKTSFKLDDGSQAEVNKTISAAWYIDTTQET